MSLPKIETTLLLGYRIYFLSYGRRHRAFNCQRLRLSQSLHYERNLRLICITALSRYLFNHFLFNNDNCKRNEKINNKIREKNV